MSVWISVISSFFWRSAKDLTDEHNGFTSHFTSFSYCLALFANCIVSGVRNCRWASDESDAGAAHVKFYQARGIPRSKYQKWHSNMVHYCNGTIYYCNVITSNRTHTHNHTKYICILCKYIYIYNSHYVYCCYHCCHYNIIVFTQQRANGKLPGASSPGTRCARSIPGAKQRKWGSPAQPEMGPLPGPVLGMEKAPKWLQNSSKNQGHQCELPLWIACDCPHAASI